MSKILLYMSRGDLTNWQKYVEERMKDCDIKTFTSKEDMPMQHRFNMLKKSDVVLFNLDGFDTDMIWEASVAWAKRKPVVAYDSTQTINAHIKYKKANILKHLFPVVFTNCKDVCDYILSAYN